jgi:putative ATPase
VIGSEAHGVSEEFRKSLKGITIPTRGGVAERRRGGRGGALRSRPAKGFPVSLFDAAPVDEQGRPLAERMRPERLEDFVGQEHILGPGKPLRAQIESDRLTSIILWGPPGVGKTTLAKLVAHHTKAQFIPFSAVLSGMKEIKAVMADAERNRRLGYRTVLFIDEIHRFNKAQQDAFLPYVERGDVILIGATTENPSFEVISALLSRSKVYALRPLTVEETVTLLRPRAAAWSG